MDDGDDDATILAAFAEFDRNMSSGLDLLLAAMPSLTQEQPPPVDDAHFLDNLAQSWCSQTRWEVLRPFHSWYVYDGIISI